MNLKNKNIIIKCIVIAILSYTHTYSQENIVKINGIVRSDSTFLRDINIINKTKSFGVSSNQKGAYELYAALGDTIQYSSVNYNERTIIISKNHVLNKRIIVYLEPVVNELDEILLEQKIREDWAKYVISPGAILDIDAMDLKAAPNARKLTDPTYGNLGGVNFGEIASLLLGNVFKNKRERNKLKQQEQLLKDAFAEKIHDNYGEKYFINELKIKDYKIYLFLDYCIDNGLNNYHNKHELAIKNFLFQQSQNFNQLNK